MRYGASLSHPYLPDIWAAEKKQLEAETKAAEEAIRLADKAKSVKYGLKETKKEEKKDEQPSK